MDAKFVTFNGESVLVLKSFPFFFPFFQRKVKTLILYNIKHMSP